MNEDYDRICAQINLKRMVLFACALHPDLLNPEVSDCYDILSADEYIPSELLDLFKNKIEAGTQTEVFKYLTCLGDELEALESMSSDERQTSDETYQWRKTAESVGAKRLWCQPKILGKIKHAVENKFPYTIVEPEKINAFLNWCQEQCKIYKLENRRDHDDIIQKDEAVRVFQLRTMIRFGEKVWLFQVAQWIHNILKVMKEDRNRQRFIGTKTRNLWIYGPTLMGKTEYVVRRIRNEFPVWMVGKIDKPNLIDIFSVIDQPEKLKQETILSILCMCCVLACLEFSRTLLFMIIVFIFFFFSNVVKDECNQSNSEIPPLIVCSNYSLKQWLEQAKVEKTFADCLQKYLFTEVHANERGVWGLYWQDYTVQSMTSGYQFNLRTEIYDEIYKKNESFKEHESVDILTSTTVKFIKEWQKLKEKHIIPEEIPADCSIVGSKTVKPVKGHFNKWKSSCTESVTNFNQWGLSATLYQQHHMNDDNTNESNDERNDEIDHDGDDDGDDDDDNDNYMNTNQQDFVKTENQKNSNTKNDLISSDEMIDDD